jgi:hypothetical protein
VPLEEPHLYIVAVVINQHRDNSVNLKYAADIEAKLKIQAATLDKQQHIHYELLTDNEATKAAILNKISNLTKTIKPNDSFILFAAWNGILLRNQYYMLTNDYYGMMDNNSMISYNEIVEITRKIKSLSQLLIFDTCHVGGMNTIVGGLYDARMSVLAKKMGLHIYALVSDKQSAMDVYKNNGLFTHVLLNSLSTNRDAGRNKNWKVTIIDLGEHAKTKAAEISIEIGNAQTPLIINFWKDSPIYKRP